MLNLRVVLMLLITGLALGLVSATGYALRRWTDGWRWIAGGPLLYLVAVALKIIVEVRADSTAHNLWPFEALTTLVIASTVLGGLYLVRFFTIRLTRSHNL